MEKGILNEKEGELMAKSYPYLAFKQAKEALSYYERVFSATNLYRLPIPKGHAEQFNLRAEDLADSTIHGSFDVLGTTIFCSDAFGYDVEPSRQISIMLDLDWEDSVAVKEANDFYQKVLDSGEATITMNFDKQVWGGKMGHIVDKYGINWMLHAHPYSEITNNWR